MGDLLSLEPLGGPRKKLLGLPISKFDVYRDLCTMNEIIFEYSEKRSVFKV